MASQKVLIVDDSKAVRMQVREMLPKGNFEVLEAGDGIEGLEMIQRECPNLIVLDFFMPRMNGWEVMQRIQTHPKYKSIPVVLMSGRREEVEEKIPDLFDYFEFIGKPFEPSMLVQAIKVAMTKARNRQTSAAMPQAVRTPSSASPSSPDVASGSTTSGSVASNSPAASSGTDSLQTLKAEILALRQENTVLKGEVEGLKKQVVQIMAFLRQRTKP